MAVFRIEKTRDYTVMSNHHLKDRTLTLKSKGLLSMMLSLPDEWNYTTRGLAAICREGVDSIGAALKELETHGYIRRTQLRDEKGKITDTEYILKLVNALIMNTKGEGEKSSEDFWVKAERLYYSALIGYICRAKPSEKGLARLRPERLSSKSW